MFTDPYTVITYRATITAKPSMTIKAVSKNLYVTETQITVTRVCIYFHLCFEKLIL